MEEFAEVDDEAETLDGLFVDAADAVVDKVGREEHGHEEYLGICLLSFFERAEAFGIHDHVLDGGVVGVLEEFRPNPESLGAGIDGGSDLKA